MGYGGSNFSGTLNVDLVTADVSAIVGGICGYYSNTLTDVVAQLGYVANNLFDFTYYRSIADVLVSIEQLLYRFQFDGSGRLYVQIY